MRAFQIELEFFLIEFELDFNFSARFDYRHTVDVAENLLPIICAQMGHSVEKQVIKKSKYLYRAEYLDHIDFP